MHRVDISKAPTRVYTEVTVLAQNDLVFHQLVELIQQLSPTDTAHQGKRYARWMLSCRSAIRSYLTKLLGEPSAMSPVRPKSRVVDGRRTVCVELAGHLST